MKNTKEKEYTVTEGGTYQPGVSLNPDSFDFILSEPTEVIIKSIGEISPESTFRITSSNPVKEVITLTGPEEEKIRVTLYDCTGKTVLESNRTVIPASSLTSGLYFPEMNGETVKIIKQ